MKLIAKKEAKEEKKDGNVEEAVTKEKEKPTKGNPE